MIMLQHAEMFPIANKEINDTKLYKVTYELSKEETIINTSASKYDTNILINFCEKHGYSYTCQETIGDVIVNEFSKTFDNNSEPIDCNEVPCDETVDMLTNTYHTDESIEFIDDEDHFDYVGWARCDSVINNKPVYPCNNDECPYNAYKGMDCYNHCDLRI